MKSLLVSLKKRLLREMKLFSPMGSKVLMLSEDGLFVDANEGEEAFDPTERVARRNRTVMAPFFAENSSDPYSDLLSLSQNLDADDNAIFLTYSRMWYPIARILTLGRGNSFLPKRYVAFDVLLSLLGDAKFSVVGRRSFVVLPGAAGRRLGHAIGRVPILRHAVQFQMVIARPLKQEVRNPSVSVIVAARNEAGNLPQLFDRIPNLGSFTEVITVEGNSKDDTLEVARREAEERSRSASQHDLTDESKMRWKVFEQAGKGKGDAVRLGIERASGDIIVILDADLSVRPEELTRFVEVLATGRAQFANGTRLVYPMEDEAMRFLNILGNRLFALLFTFLIGQTVRDTLCGTKVFWREHYVAMSTFRTLSHELDPFGDFDFLLGAALGRLEIVDIPVHYDARTYGSTNISRFKDGWNLARLYVKAVRILSR